VLALNVKSSTWADFGVDDNVVKTEFQTTADHNDGEWHHVVGVRDLARDKLFIYVDGELEAEAEDVTDGSTSNSYDLQIGRFNAGGWSYFNGLMDDVRIYNRALSLEEVTELYETTRRDLETGLVLHYTFDEDEGAIVTDWSPTGNTGTMHGATWRADGRIGGCYEFDGIDDYIEMGPTDIYRTQGQFSGSLWLCSRNPGGYLISNFHGGNYYPGLFSFSYVRSQHRINVSLGQVGGNLQYMSTPNLISTGLWHHIAFSYDESRGDTDKVRFYLDGEQIVTDVHVEGPGNEILGIGERLRIMTNRGGEKTPGKLDDVRLYNRAISAEEVQALYAMGAADRLDEGLVLHYTFDADQGTTVVDSSGSGNDGTAVNLDYEASFSGLAPRFSSRNTYAVCRGAGLNVNGWTDLTCSAWVKLNSRVAYEYVMTRGIPALDRYAGFIMGTGVTTPRALVYFAPESGQNLDLQTDASVIVGEWFHIASVYDGEYLRFYLDGAEVDSIPVPPEYLNAGLWDDPASELVIGRSAAHPGWMNTHVNGWIDEVRMYERALSAQEVQALYAMGAGDELTLTVAGTPEQYGSPSPYAYGVHAVPSGDAIVETVDTPVSGDPGVRQVCAGWTGAGSVPASGSGNSVSFTITQDSTVTWIWGTEYYLDTEAGPGGSVDVEDGWYAGMTEVTVEAIPAAGYEFDGWTGDVPAGHETDNPLTVTMDGPLDLTASFAADLGEGLVLHYTFDADAGTTVLDSSGSGNDGTAVNLDYEASFSGLAPRFRSRNTYVVSDAEGVDVTGWTRLTCAAWVKIYQRESYQYGVIAETGHPDSSGFTGFALWYGGGVTLPRFQVRFGSGSSEYGRVDTDGWRPDLNTWYHIVGVYDGEQVHYYVDGVEKNSSTVPVGFVDSPLWEAAGGKLEIGRMAHNPGWDNTHVNGWVDEVRLYDRALSAAEVLALYQMSAPAARPAAESEGLRCRVESAEAGGLTIGWDDKGDGAEYTLFWTTNLLEGFLPIRSKLTGGSLTIELPREKKGFFKVGTGDGSLNRR